ncbi:MAG: glycosidase [Micromonosporaceae bacterium]|nr:glycosidase [Micromonosporaceae bacterium]
MTELFTRSPANPLLTADDWPYPVNSVFNPGAAVVNGETVLLCRVEDRRGISHLSVARSADGATGWRVDKEPLVAPGDHADSSRWGVEDPRVTRVDELDSWLVTYTAYGPEGPGVALATTRDFRSVERVGVVLPPADKNAALLPRLVDGQFALFHRPMSEPDRRADVWLSRSRDLRSWSTPQLVLAARPGGWWDNVRIGMGPPPLWTPQGWLAIYHGIKEVAAGLVYRVGVVLLDLAQPQRVLRRGEDWVFAASAPYERVGDAPNVVFPTGLLHDPERDQVRLYYGAADSCVALATASYSELLAYALSCPEPDQSRSW